MRKQDRIANEQRRPEDRDRNQSQRTPQDRERMTGRSDSEHTSGDGSETQRPQRQSGKLPLPD